MSIKIALLGFGTLASGHCISTEGKRRENRSSLAHSEIDVKEVLVGDDAEKERL